MYWPAGRERRGIGKKSGELCVLMTTAALCNVAGRRLTAISMTKPTAKYLQLKRVKSLNYTPSLIQH